MIIKFKLRYLFAPSFIALLGGIYALIGNKHGAVFQWMFGLGFLGFVGCALSVVEWGKRKSFEIRDKIDNGPAMTAVHKNVRQKDPLLIRFLGSKLFGFLFWTFIVAIILFIVWQFIQGRASFQLLP